MSVFRHDDDWATACPHCGSRLCRRVYHDNAYHESLTRLTTQVHRDMLRTRWERATSRCNRRAWDRQHPPHLIAGGAAV